MWLSVVIVLLAVSYVVIFKKTEVGAPGEGGADREKIIEAFEKNSANSSLSIEEQNQIISTLSQKNPENMSAGEKAMIINQFHTQTQ